MCIFFGSGYLPVTLASVFQCSHSSRNSCVIASSAGNHSSLIMLGGRLSALLGPRWSYPKLCQVTSGEFKHIRRRIGQRDASDVVGDRPVGVASLALRDAAIDE